MIDKRINLGGSIQIKGDLKGSEDVMIDGDLEGNIYLEGHCLTIGEHGHIRGQIKAREVTVAGKMLGNVTASDKVEVAATGSVQGDISAPRLVLADGASVKGKIDMRPRSTSEKRSGALAT